MEKIHTILNDIEKIKKLENNIFFKKFESYPKSKLLDLQVNFIHILRHRFQILAKNMAKIMNINDRNIYLEKLIKEKDNVDIYFKYLQNLGYIGTQNALLNKDNLPVCVEKYITQLNTFDENFNGYEMSIILGTIDYLLYDILNTYFKLDLNINHNRDDLFMLGLNDKMIRGLGDDELLELLYTGYKILYDYFTSLYEDFFGEIKE